MPSDKKPEPETLDLFAPRSAPRVARRIEAPDERPAKGLTADEVAASFAWPRAEAALAASQQAPIDPASGRAHGGAAATVVPEPGGPRSYRVSEIVRLAGRALEARFSDVWVEGEVSNCRTPGHCYFTLKDPEGQLPAVMFRSAFSRLKFRLADGLKVRARGRLSIYDVQGKLQLYVEAVEPAGLGALQLAFEQLKRKLAAEGLFDEERKRPLPFLPRRIGVATSASGAVVRDIIRVAGRRGPARILIASCLVQGAEAPADIVRALVALQQQPDIDLIIVGRGGGSVEDLSAFNDEAVARAIAACRVPVISAVGHEVDFTIADFVADRRAATPSQAAELAVPVHAELERGLEHLRTQLARAGRRTVSDARTRLDNALGRAGDLLQRNIAERRRVLRQAEGRLQALHPRARIARDRALFDGLSRRLARPLPDRLTSGRSALQTLRPRLDAALQQELAGRRRALEHLCGKLDGLSPLRVLERGYGLVRDGRGGVVTRAVEVRPGDRITVHLAHGSLGAVVERSDEEDPT